jgi:hypothetical protein
MKRAALLCLFLLCTSLALAAQAPNEEPMTPAGRAAGAADLLEAAKAWTGQLGELAPIAERALASAEGWDVQAFDCRDLAASGLYMDTVEFARRVPGGEAAGPGAEGSTWLVSISFTFMRMRRADAAQTTEQLVLGVSSGSRFVEFNTSFIDGLPQRPLIVRGLGDKLAFTRLDPNLAKTAETTQMVPDPSAPISLRSYSLRLDDLPPGTDKVDMTSYSSGEAEVVVDRFAIDRARGLMTIVVGKPGKELVQEVSFDSAGLMQTVALKPQGLVFAREDPAAMLAARGTRTDALASRDARVETDFESGLARMAMPAAKGWSATIELEARGSLSRRLEDFADPRGWEFRHGAILFRSGSGWPRFKSVPQSKLEEWTRPANSIESDSPEIAAAAREATQGTLGAKAKALAVTAWVFKRLRYDTGALTVGALRTLQTGHGDCTEFSGLIVAMLRSLGIPATTVHGFYYDPVSAAFVGHAWVLARVGSAWLELEGTSGKAAEGSGYLPLPLKDNLSLVRRIKVADVR